MAELKSAVMGLLTVLFVATATVSLYSFALTNNTNNGGSGTTISFPLQNQIAGYKAQMNNYSSQLANATMSASDAPSASLSSIGGIGALTTAGTAAISLSFSAVGILITMVASVGVSLVPLGIPDFVFGFGILGIAIGIIFAILAAVFKWWI